MSYPDEQLLKKREQQKKQEHQTLEQGMYLNGKTVAFTRRLFFNAFSILLPDSWKQMPAELARIKYPSEFRPRCIITNVDLSVNMGFNVFPWPSEQSLTNVEKVAEKMLERLFQETANLIFLQFTELEVVNGCWFAYRSHGMDGDLFNQLIIAKLGDNLIMSNFNCPYQRAVEWQDWVIMMWESMELWQEEKI